MDNSNHTITYTPWTTDLHQAARRAIRALEDTADELDHRGIYLPALDLRMEVDRLRAALVDTETRQARERDQARARELEVIAL